MNAYDCPNCGSHNTQSFDSVHASNVCHSYGGTHGSYESWSPLAAQTAPPQNPHVGCGAVVGVFALTILVFSLTAVVLSFAIEPFAGLFTNDNRFVIIYLPAFILSATTFIGGLIFMSKKVERQLPDYRQRVDNYNRSMLCRRCGYAWERNY